MDAYAGQLSLDVVPCADVEERVAQTHAVRNGFEVAGLKASGADEVRVKGLGSDEVLDDVVRSGGQHGDDIVDVDFAEQQRQDGRPIFVDSIMLGQKSY